MRVLGLVEPTDGNDQESFIRRARAKLFEALKDTDGSAEIIFSRHLVTIKARFKVQCDNGDWTDTERSVNHESDPFFNTPGDDDILIAEMAHAVACETRRARLKAPSRSSIEFRVSARSADYLPEDEIFSYEAIDLFKNERANDLVDLETALAIFCSSADQRKMPKALSLHRVENGLLCCPRCLKPRERRHLAIYEKQMLDPNLNHFAWACNECAEIDQGITLDRMLDESEAMKWTLHMLHKDWTRHPRMVASWLTCIDGIFNNPSIYGL